MEHQQTIYLDSTDLKITASQFCLFFISLGKKILVCFLKTPFYQEIWDDYKTSYSDVGLSYF